MISSCIFLLPGLCYSDKQKPSHSVAPVPTLKPAVEDTPTSSEGKPDVKPIVAPKTSRPVSKKLPDLNKVLESDSESLQLDATVSNAESDDFDFSSEK